MKKLEAFRQALQESNRPPLIDSIHSWNCRSGSILGEISRGADRCPPREPLTRPGPGHCRMRPLNFFGNSTRSGFPGARKELQILVNSPDNIDQQEVARFSWGPTPFRCWYGRNTREIFAKTGRIITFAGKGTAAFRMFVAAKHHLLQRGCAIFTSTSSRFRYKIFGDFQPRQMLLKAISVGTQYRSCFLQQDPASSRPIISNANHGRKTCSRTKLPR